MKVALSHGRFTIDNRPGTYIGSYEVDADRDWIEAQESKPDTTWSTLDSSGHFHAVDSKASKFPTLVTRSVHVTCDGACGGHCDGYSAHRWHCVICDEQVEPKFNTSTRIVLASEQWSWRADISGGPFIEPGTRVTVRISSDWEARLGIATVGEIAMESGKAGVSMTLHGSGVLGYLDREVLG